MRTSSRNTFKVSSVLLKGPFIFKQMHICLVLHCFKMFCVIRDLCWAVANSAPPSSQHFGESLVDKADILLPLCRQRLLSDA